MDKIPNHIPFPPKTHCVMDIATVNRYLFFPPGMAVWVMWNKVWFPGTVVTEAGYVNEDVHVQIFLQATIVCVKYAHLRHAPLSYSRVPTPMEVTRWWKTLAPQQPPHPQRQQQHCGHKRSGGMLEWSVPKKRRPPGDVSNPIVIHDDEDDEEEEEEEEEEEIKAGELPNMPAGDDLTDARTLLYLMQQVNGLDEAAIDALLSKRKDMHAIGMHMLFKNPEEPDLPPASTPTHDPERQAHVDTSSTIASSSEWKHAREVSENLVRQYQRNSHTIGPGDRVRIQGHGWSTIVSVSPPDHQGTHTVYTGDGMSYGSREGEAFCHTQHWDENKKEYEFTEDIRWLVGGMRGSLEIMSYWVTAATVLNRFVELKGCNTRAEVLEKFKIYDDVELISQANFGMLRSERMKRLDYDPMVTKAIEEMEYMRPPRS